MTTLFSRLDRSEISAKTHFFPTRSRRDIRENSNHQLFHTKFVWNLSFSIKMVLVETGLRAHIKKMINATLVAQLVSHQEI